MSIVVTAMKIDGDGDAGYVLDVVNKTGVKVDVYSEQGWEVDGSEVADPVLLMTIGAGESAEGFIWFDHEQFKVATLGDLKNVEGAIAVIDHDTSKRIARYPVKL